MAWKFSVLVVANVTSASDELLAALISRAERDQCAFTLLVPATGGGKAAREAAQGALEKALERIQGAGLEVEGMVGDGDPVIAVHDVWDPRRFDEIVISTLPTGASRWLAVDLPHRVEKFTGVQVEHVVAAEPRPPVRTEPAPEPERYGVLSPLAAITGKRNAT
jgi:hypothetical protein